MDFDDSLTQRRRSIDVSLCFGAADPVDNTDYKVYATSLLLGHRRCVWLKRKQRATEVNGESEVTQEVAAKDAALLEA